MDTSEKVTSPEEEPHDRRPHTEKGGRHGGGCGDAEPEAEDPQGEPGQGPQAGAHAVARASVRAPAEGDMRAFGRRLAPVLCPGDLLVLAGALGAGKTTFVQGLGEGLGVETPVTSPTFVIARFHAVPRGGIPLVHADAYRLGSIAELDDLDLETPAEEAVTVVEWGEGMAEELADERLELFIERRDGEERVVHLTGVGRRWQGVLG